MHMKRDSDRKTRLKNGAQILIGITSMKVQEVRMKYRKSAVLPWKLMFSRVLVWTKLRKCYRK